jgi:protein TorT
MTPGSYQGIENGIVLAAAADPAVLTSRISVDLAVRALQKAEYATHVAPELTVVDSANFSTWNRSTTLAPDDWQPTFSYQPK